MGDKIMKHIINNIKFKKEMVSKLNRYLFSGNNLEKISKYKEKKKVIFCLSPDYGNMGDQAIAFATTKFIKDNFNEYEFIEFERDEFYSYAKAIEKIVNEDDIIAIQGGGNMGNLYLREELARRLILKKIKKGKIVSMPTTLSFTNDNKGIYERNKMKKIYNNSQRLLLIAREEKTFNMMKELFTAKTILTPDIVFYLEDIFEPNNERKNNIVTCLRNDKEAYWGVKKDKFLKELRNKYPSLIETDTVLQRNIDINRREDELYTIWNKFRDSKVVITDRLHGMIFAFITKTPCIVLRSCDHKIIESYKWIKDINYIKFIDDLDFNIIDKEIEGLMRIDKFDRTNFKEKYFNELVKIIKEVK